MIIGGILAEIMVASADNIIATIISNNITIAIKDIIHAWKT